MMMMMMMMMMRTSADALGNNPGHQRDLRLATVLHPAPPRDAHAFVWSTLLHCCVLDRRPTRQRLQFAQ